MLSVKAQQNLSNAKNYFKEHLAHGDYYSEKETVQGQWQGAGCERLGVRGGVTEEQFLRMCEGKHPVSGEQLTVRQNTTRKTASGEDEANRRVFYDWVMLPPKSVSMHANLHDDETRAGLIQDHNEAVAIAVTELEQFAATRVRKGGETSDRRTGNIVVAKFQHDTSREQDMLIHTHCVVMNATYDEVEGRWKALQNYEQLKAQKFVRNVYHHEYMKRLHRRGIPTVRTKHGFEIDGYYPEEIELFSKRRTEILKIADELKSKPGYDNLSAGELKERVAHEYRARKIKDGSIDDLREKWRQEIGEAALVRTSYIGGKQPVKIAWNLDNAFDWAKEYLFERKAVVRMHELESAVMQKVLGSECTIEDVRAHCAKKHTGLVIEADTSRVTSIEALGRELRCVDVAKNGRGTKRPIVADVEQVLSKTALVGEQREAAATVLGSKDEVTLFTGRAGTGKSTVLKVIHAALVESGSPLIVCAPGTGQVESLKEDKLPSRTLASVLTAKELPAGCIVLLDEAGQVGGKTFDELLNKIHSARGRLICSGDTRQHGAVEASDILMAIEKNAAVTTAKITVIHRQNPDLASTPEERARVEGYREAVRLASVGQAVQSFEKLQEVGVVTEIRSDEKIPTVTKKYLESRDAGMATVIATETRAFRDAINDDVAAALAKRGDVKESRPMLVYCPVDVTKAELKLPETFEHGDYIRWVKDYGVHKAGSVEMVWDANEKGILLAGYTRRVSLNEVSKKGSLIEVKEIGIGIGTRIQTKQNSVVAKGPKLINGELLTVRRINKDDTIVAVNGAGEEKTIPPDKQMLGLGYCVTSFAAQGKTAMKVIVADAGSVGATTSKAWYVSISRGRRAIEVVTSSIADLTKRIGREGTREFATSVAGKVVPKPTLKTTIAATTARVSDLAHHIADSGIKHAQTAGKLLKKATQKIRNRVEPKQTL